MSASLAVGLALMIEHHNGFRQILLVRLCDVSVARRTHHQNAGPDEEERKCQQQ